MKKRIFAVLSAAIFLFSEIGMNVSAAANGKLVEESTEVNEAADIREDAIQTVLVSDKAQTVTVSDVEYTILSDGTVEVTDGSKCSGTVSIPAEVTIEGRAYQVAAIGSKAFSGNTAITSIEMPETITKIEDGTYDGWEVSSAFKGCTALKKVSFSSELTYIGKWAFLGCSSLTDVTLPAKLDTIAENAFGNCRAITTITLPKTTKTVGQCAFSGTSLKTFTIPKETIMFHEMALDQIETLESVQVQAGHPNYISEGGVWYTTGYGWLVLYPAAKAGDTYTLNTATTTIRSTAFWKTQYLKTLTFSANLESVGTAAFQKSSVETFQIASGNKNFKAISGVLYSADGKKLLLYPTGKKTKIFFVPDSVEKIGETGTYTFDSNPYIQEIYIPSSVKSIDTILWDCTSLKKVVFSQKSQVTQIPEACFQGCTSLESICLPASINSFSTDSPYGNEFMGCSSLKTLYAASGAGIYQCNYFGNQSLQGCDNLCIYGYGTSHALKTLADTYSYPYVDVSKFCSLVLGVTFQDTLLTLKKGESSTWKAVVYPETAANQKVAYKSGNTAVATVSSGGVVTGTGTGTCYITATTQDGSGEYARCKVTVKEQKSSEVTVTFVSNGGSNCKAKKVTCGEAYGKLPSPTRKGYTFQGWYTKKSGGSKVTKATTVKKKTNHKLYAHWKKVTKPGKVKVKSVTGGKRAFTLRLTRKVSGAEGYEICYSVNAKFKQGTVKKVTMTAASKKVSGLKSKQTYYVKVRAYKIDSKGGKVYGSYSSVKKVKTK